MRLLRQICTRKTISMGCIGRSASAHILQLQSLNRAVTGIRLRAAGLAQGRGTLRYQVNASCSMQVM